MVSDKNSEIGSQTSEIIYWAFAGGLLGLGVIALSSIGCGFLILSAGLILYGTVKISKRHAWVMLVGMGGLPTALMLYTYLTATPCGSQMELTSYGGTVSCTSFDSGYLSFVAFFTTIALIGVVWGLLKWQLSKRFTKI
jgi:hypothetical protein